MQTSHIRSKVTMPVTSLVLGSVGAWASFVCLIFSTIFRMKAWLLFSFLAMIISRTNHRALRAKQI